MNVLLIKCWLKEEGEALIGTRLAGAIQVSPKAIALELASQQGHVFMLISVEQGAQALCLLDQEDLPEQRAPGNFAKAIKFHLAGYDLASISQQGFDRSIVFTFRHQDTYGKVSEKVLRVELAGRASNAFIISERGMVVSIFKAYKKGASALRHIMTGKPLPDVPPLGKFVAGEQDEYDLENELAQIAQEEGVLGETALEHLLTRRVAGGEPRLWDMLEKLLPVEHSISSLYAFIAKFQRGELSGELFALSESNRANDVAKGLWRPAASGGAGQAGAGGAKVQQAKNRLSQLLAQKAVVDRADEIAELSLMILDRAEQVDAEGGARGFLEEVMEGYPDWADQLDPAKSALDNGRELANYCERLRRAAPKLDELIATAQADCERIQANTADGILGSLEKGGRRKADPMGGAADKLSKHGIKYMRFMSSDGIPILCGTNDRSNDGLIKIFGSGRHLWFHARDYAGSHVILLTGGVEPPMQSIMDAALVAGYYSQGRNEGELEVSYLPMKHLRRPKNAKPGQVLKMQEKVVAVKPGQFEDRRSQLTYKSG